MSNKLDSLTHDFRLERLNYHLLPLSRLSALEISNEKLASLNSISEKNFQAFSMEFKHQTHTLLVMKKQLDSCFRRIRSLKSKLAIQYPEAFQGKACIGKKSLFKILHLCSCYCSVSDKR